MTYLFVPPSLPNCTTYKLISLGGRGTLAMGAFTSAAESSRIETVLL